MLSFVQTFVIASASLRAVLASTTPPAVISTTPLDTSSFGITAPSSSSYNAGVVSPSQSVDGTTTLEVSQQVTATYTLVSVDATSWASWSTTTSASEWDSYTSSVVSESAWVSWTSTEQSSTESWESWPTTTAASTQWSTWSSEGPVTITFVETYLLPCSTGWETETTTIYTTHCGCTATPVPEHPYTSVYTTECPGSWGLGMTVTVSVPTAQWTPAPSQAQCDEYDNCGNTPAASQTTWATWESASIEATSTWLTMPLASPEAAAATTSSGPQWSPVATWTGAAAPLSFSKNMVVAAGIIAGLARYL